MLFRGSRRHRAGAFTLVEILCAVTIVAMLASIAIPNVVKAMRKGRRNAAVSDMRVFRQAMTSYATAHDGYPTWGKLDFKTLEELGPQHHKTPHQLVSQFEGNSFAWYFPFDILDWRGFGFPLANPTAFSAMGKLKTDPGMRILVTDAATYLWTPEGIVPAGDN